VRSRAVWHQNGYVTPAPCDPLRFIVDSEVFEVVEAPGQPGGCHYTWTSGPHPGYGFTSVPSDGHQFSVAEHEAAIREFLLSINPETGYLD
jgi:hypothetical protein